MWSFTWIPYRVKPDKRHTSIWLPLYDSIDLCTQSNPCRFFPLTHLGTTADFAVETVSVFLYFASRITGRHPAPTGTKFRRAFDPSRSIEQQGANDLIQAPIIQAPISK